MFAVSNTDDKNELKTPDNNSIANRSENLERINRNISNSEKINRSLFKDDIANSDSKLQKQASCDNAAYDPGDPITLTCKRYFKEIYISNFFIKY